MVDISKWSGRTIGVDKTSIATDRTFNETHLMGRNEKEEYICQSWNYQELHGPTDSLEVLKGNLDSIKKRQQELKVPETNYYKWEGMIMDNAAEGKGVRNGLGAKFNRLRRKDFEEYHTVLLFEKIPFDNSSNHKEGETFHPLTPKGCEDHNASLVEKALLKAFLTQAKKYNTKKLVYKDRLGIYHFAPHVLVKIAANKYAFCF